MEFPLMTAQPTAIHSRQEHDEYKQKVMEQDLELQDLKRRLDRLEGAKRAKPDSSQIIPHPVSVFSGITTGASMGIPYPPYPTKI